MDSLFFSEILKNNNILNSKIKDKPKIEVKVLSNITLNQFKPIVEYSLNTHEIFISVKVGEYDNIIKESCEINNEIPIIFWELSNLSDGFVFEIENFNEDKIKLFKDKVFNDIDLLFLNLEKCKTVIFNKFSHLGFSYNLYKKSKFQNFVEDVNQYLENNLPENFEIIDIDKPIATCSIIKTFNFRNFYNNKSLYSVDFFKSYSNFIHPVLRGISGKTKKCIVLDCDNTLWSGIIGEDGPNDVKFDISDLGEGKYFYFVNEILKSLQNNGIILCLASKNNYSDVEHFFSINKKRLSLNFEDFIVKKINWESKHENIKEIAKELNIGLDSFVFIDDSDFEINLIKSFSPEISTFQVPKNIFEYPHLLINIKNLFYNKIGTEEDLNRNKMYHENIKRNSIKKKSLNIDDYIKSLNIEIEISENNFNEVERLSQLTQKTNQFNLSTKRYEIVEIKSFLEKNNSTVFSINVKDMFGKLGTTGLCIVIFEKNTAIIDTFLMSCRILGRKIEHSFMKELFDRIIDTNPSIDTLIARYIPSEKNSPIKSFLNTIESSKTEMKDGMVEFAFTKPIIINNKIHKIVWKNN